MVVAIKYKTMWQSFLVGSGAVLLTTLFHWVTGRKKSFSEVNKIHAETMLASITSVDKVIEIWKNLATRLTVQVENLTAEVTQLKVEVQKLQIEVIGLTEEKKHLGDTINHLEQRIKDNVTPKI